MTLPSLILCPTDSVQYLGLPNLSTPSPQLRFLWTLLEFPIFWAYSALLCVVDCLVWIFGSFRQEVNLVSIALS